MDENARQHTPRYDSPILLLILVTSLIFVSEAIVMHLIPVLLPAILLPAVAYIDSILLVILILPILYLSVFRQSRLHISELIKANEQLQTRITERNQAEQALQLERNKLKGILDAMADGVYIVNPHHQIQYVNPAIEKEFGPVNGRKCHEYFHDRMEICPWCKISKVSAGESMRSEQYFPKNEKTYEVFNTPLINGDGAISKLAIFHDVSEGKKAEKALRESEERFRMLVETMNEGLGIIDENGVWTYVNDGLCSMLGYFPGDLIGRPVIEFADKTNQEVLKEQMARRRNGEWTPYEITYRSGYGKKRNVLVSPRPMFATDRQFRGSFAIITDITELKQTEESLRKSEAELRYLSSQLLTAQESERRRISRELHDELGQSLAVLKLQLSLTKKRLPDTLQHQYEEQMDSIDQIIENVRRLSRDLRPAVLDDLGLSAALQWLIKNFEKNFNIKITADTPDINPLFPHDAQIMIYRVFQEALTNIGKHAGAKNVSVVIKREKDRVSFVVEDDGKGFDLTRAQARHTLDRGFGLSTMDERIRMLEGSLNLWSQEGTGTRISFTIPISNGRPMEKGENFQ